MDETVGSAAQLLVCLVCFCSILITSFSELELKDEFCFIDL
jgi:hypothetical protein